MTKKLTKSDITRVRHPGGEKGNEWGGHKDSNIAGLDILDASKRLENLSAVEYAVTG